MRVIYVAGWMRSGTTVLGDILGAQPEGFNAGEVSNIWIDAARGGRCSCGEPLTQCELWGQALKDALTRHGMTHDDLGRLSQSYQRVFRTRNAVALSRQSERPAGRRELSDVTATLLERALAISGKTVLIDTSKMVPGIQLHGLIGNDVQIVHITRDPRAVAASELRTRDHVPGNEESIPPGSGAALSAVRWTGTNVSISAAMGLRRGRDVRISYEALLEDPAMQAKRLCQQLDYTFDPTSITNRTLRVPFSHVAVGNPKRAQAGEITLNRPDGRVSLSRRDSVVVDAITAGYRQSMRRRQGRGRLESRRRG